MSTTTPSTPQPSPGSPQPTPDTPRPTAPTLSWRARAWMAVWPRIKRIFEPVDDPPLPAPCQPFRPPPTRAAVTYRLARPILAAAQGGVFDFQVSVAFTWTACGLHREELAARSRELSVLPYREVKRMAIDLASRYAPHRAAELEARLNGQLASKPIRFECDQVDVRCQPEVIVRLDERLRRQLEPAWEKMARMEAEHEVNRRRAELVDDLNHRWLAILERQSGSRVASAAALLTDSDFADAVRQAAKDQQETVERLAALLEVVRRDGQANGDRATIQIIELLTAALRDQLGRAENGQPGGTSNPLRQRTDPDSTTR